MRDQVHTPEVFKLLSDYQTQVDVGITREGYFSINHFSGGGRLVELDASTMRESLKLGYFSAGGLFGHYHIQSPELWEDKILPVVEAIEMGEFEREIDGRIHVLAAKFQEAQSLRAAMATLEKRIHELEGAGLYDE